MADEKTTFKLDLDAKEFIEHGLKAKETIERLGESESLAGLTEGFLAAGAAVGVIGTAVLAVKETMDLVFEGENIRAVNAQFEKLSENAGVYGENLKKGLIEAAHGWVDDTELMKAANKALVELETGAEHLPEIMDLARKATAVMGGDFLQNFEAMNQAIASGNTRHLRHLGIIIDQKKAYEDYAKSIGVTVGELSLAGRQQAVLNAVLEKGKTSFDGVADGLRQNQNLWAQFKTTMKETGEVFALAFEKIAGPLVKTELSGLSAIAKDVKTWFLDKFGEGAEQASAHSERLIGKVNSLKAQIIDLEQAQLRTNDAFKKAEYGVDINLLTEKLKGLTAELDSAKDSQKEILSQSSDNKPGEAGKEDTSTVDLDKKRERETKFAQEMLALRRQVTQEDLANAESIEEADELYKQKKLEDAKEIELQIAQIKAQAATGNGITEEEANEKIELLNEIKNQRMVESDEEMYAARKQALDNYVKNSENSFQGFGRAAAAASYQAKAGIDDFSKNSERRLNSFKQHSMDAFHQIGAGTKSATEAMKGMVFNMLADEADAYGQMYLLAGVASFNPAEMAAGAGLITLAGFLRSQAQGGGLSSSAGGGGVSPSGGNAPYVTPVGQDGALPVANSGPSVNVTIAGHLFQTQEAQNWLVDTIRKASDSTDLKITGVNG